MSVLTKLSLKNIKSHMKESVLVVVSIALTISMMTMVLSVMLGIYDFIKERSIDSLSSSVTIWNVLDVQDFVGNLGDDVVLGYELNSAEYMVYTKNDSGFNLRPLDYNKNQEIFENTYMRESLVLSQGRLSNNIHEVVIGTENSSVNAQVGDTLQVEYTRYDPIQKKQVIQKLEVEVVGITKGYFGWYYIDDAEVLPSNEYGISLNVFIKDGTKNLDSIVEKAIAKSEMSMQGFGVEDIVSYSTTYNYFKGFQSKPGEIVFMFIIVTLVLLVLVAISTFSLILNAFGVVLNQKYHIFGIVRSIGATKSQIKSMVLLEGFLFTSIGTLVGVGLGVGLAQILVTYVNYQFGIIDTYSGTALNASIQIQYPLWALIGVAVLGFVMIHIALLMMIKSLFKLTSVDTIRKGRLKRSKKHLKLRRYSNASYGLARVYSKRSKDYRGIKIALVISTVLIIAFSSIVETITHSFGESYSKFDTEISAYSKSDTDGVDSDWEKLFELADTYSTSHGLKSKRAHQSVALTVVNKLQLHPEYIKFLKSSSIEDKMLGDNMESATLVIVDDITYSELLAIEGLSPKEGFHGLIYNSIDIKVNGNSYKGPNFEINNEETFSLEVDQQDNDILSLKVLSTSNALPESHKSILKNSYSWLQVVVSKESFDQYVPQTLKNKLVNFNTNLEIESEKPLELFKTIKADIESNDLDMYVSSNAANIAVQVLTTKMAYVISAFFFGYILLVVFANVVNIGLINYQKRRNDIAAYRSVGASKKQVNYIFVWEALFNIVGAIVFGLLVGYFASYAIYLFMQSEINYLTIKFKINMFMSVICIAFGLLVVAVEVLSITLESKKQDIITDLRRNV